MDIVRTVDRANVRLIPSAGLGAIEGLLDNTAKICGVELALCLCLAGSFIGVLTHLLPMLP